MKGRGEDGGGKRICAKENIPMGIEGGGISLVLFLSLATAVVSLSLAVNLACS